MLRNHFGPFLVVGCVLAGCGLLGCTARPPAPAHVANPADPAEQPTDDECQTFGQTFEKLVVSGNVAEVNQMIDWDTLLGRATAGPQAADKFRAEYQLGLRQKLATAPGLAGQMVDQAKKGGDYRFLRVHTVDGQKRALVRLMTGEQGNLNYHDLVLVRRPGGQVGLADMFMFASGEFLTTTMRRAYLPMAAESSPTVLDELTPNETEFVQQLPRLGAMSVERNEGRPENALEIYAQLPMSLQRDKSVLMLRLSSAEHIGEREYDAAVGEFRRAFPDEPCLDLAAVETYMGQERWELARGCLDRLEKSVGGDPYLNVLRANLSLAEDKCGDARKFAQSAIDAEDSLALAYWSLVAISLKERNYDETSRLLNVISAKFHSDFNDLKAIPDYLDYVKSPQYRKWAEKQPKRTPAEGPDGSS